MTSPVYSTSRAGISATSQGLSGQKRSGLRALLADGWGLACISALMVMFLVTILGSTGGHSGYLNMSWFQQYRDVLLKDGTLPRQLPDMWHGLGGLDFFFYGHLPYLVTSLLTLPCMNCNAPWPFAAGMGFSFGLSVLACFAFARRFVGPWAAVAGATLYALLTYHLAIDHVWRQAAGEVWAYVFTPLIARGIDVVLRDRRCSLGFPVAFALLLMTHLASAVLAAHVFALTFVVWAVVTRAPAQIWPALARLAWLAVVGLLLAGLFWLPAVVLLGDVTPEALYVEYFRATRWLLSPLSLSFPDMRTMTFVIGAILLAMIPVALAVFLTARRERRAGTWLWVLGPFLISLFLMSILSRPLWEVGLLPRVQFPWRLMVFIDLSTALAAAVCVEYWSRSRQLAAGAALVLVIGTVALNMHIIGRQDPVNRAEYLPSFPGAIEYLPRPFVDGVMARYPAEHMYMAIVNLRDHGPEIMQMQDAEVVSKRSRETVLRAPAGHDRVLLATPWWQYWQARDMRGPLVTRPDPVMGMMEISTDPPRPFEGNITVTLPWLPVEKAGVALSLAGIALFAGTAWLSRRRR